MTQPTMTTLASFTAATGSGPQDSVTLDAAGNLFGTTTNGGSAGDGTVFELAFGTGRITTRVTFTGPNGIAPGDGLLADTSGDLYGTTAQGGSTGNGTLFELAGGASSITTLVALAPLGAAFPSSGLIADAAGNLYGTTTTSAGGGGGTIFELVKDAAGITVLATFDGTNGADPAAGLTADAAGDLYGVTYGGGSASDGTIFKLSKGAATVATLATFTGANGANPASGLIADVAGDLFGTTTTGGMQGDGTIFELAQGAASVTTLASFAGTDGANPEGALVADAAGNLFGTTSAAGGSTNSGTVFELVRGATAVATLVTFTGGNGAVPVGGLTVDAAGNLYGTTRSGGTAGRGTVFELSAATTPFNAPIVATSPDTTSLLQAVTAAVALLPARDIYTDAGNAIAPAVDPGRSALFVPTDASGTVAVPSGYGYIEVAPGSNASLTGGDAATTIVGDGFTFGGAAAVVASGKGKSVITDSTTGATVLIGSIGSATVDASGANAAVRVGASGNAAITVSGSSATVIAASGSATGVTATGSGETVSIAAHATATVASSGNAQTIAMQSGATTRIVLSGSGDTIDLGTDTSTPSGDARRGAAAATAFSDRINGYAGVGNVFNVADPAGVAVIQLGTADTVNATAGLSTIFGLAADHIVAGLGSVFFVGGDASSTIQGGAANTTVFASFGLQRFDFGTAQNNVFVGGSAASTINADAGGGDVFGGPSGDDYHFGTGHAQVFIGAGGADTLSGVAGTVAPTIFATGAEHMTLAGGTPPVTIVAWASGGVIDTSATSGDNVFFAGAGGGGNQTLIGSANGVDPTGAGTSDTFIVSPNPAATAVATTISIADWHPGDVFYLPGYAPPDIATMDAAIGASVQPGAPAGLSFTLSDKTTIAFVGAHPTSFGSSAAF